MRADLTLTTLTKVTNAAFTAHGRKIVAVGCIWELIGLLPGSRVPTISEVVDLGVAGRVLGLTILVGLGVHWWGPRGTDVAVAASATSTTARS